MANTVIVRISLIVTCLCARNVIAGQRSAAGEHEQEVVLRVYNGFRIPHRDVTGAVREASEILRQAGVSTVWRDCGFGAATAEADCFDVLGSRELAIRLVQAPRLLPGDRQVFGFSQIDTATGNGTLATVFADRVAAAAERNRVNAPTLLGRTVAHEIGHLLLGTTAHTSTGLMRELWADPLLRRRTSIDEWRFTEPEAALIRGGLRARGSDTPARMALHDK